VKHKFQNTKIYKTKFTITSQRSVIWKLKMIVSLE